MEETRQSGKEIVDQRGGTESVNEDAEELLDIAKRQGSMSDKLKAAAQAIQEPGAHRDPQAPATGQAGSPASAEETGEPGSQGADEPAQPYQPPGAG